jgi:hypothetical protein
MTEKPSAPMGLGKAPSIAFPTAGVPTAHRAVVADGEDIRLVLYTGDECLSDLPLGPADALRLARELLNAARRRMGRAE